VSCITQKRNSVCDQKRTEGKRVKRLGNEAG
jgi:hypothetical protein